MTDSKIIPSSAASLANSVNNTPAQSLASTSAPPFAWSFARVPIKTYVPISLTRSDFTGVEYLGNGSNSFVYTARRGDTKVVIKMLKAQLTNRRVAAQEMISEAGILARLSHPNIIGIRGAGDDPRKFIVLELLGGGTLSQLLYPEKTSDIMINYRATNQAKNFVLPLANIIFITREIARAVKYLHVDFDENAMVIHRGENEVPLPLLHLLTSC